MKRMPLDIGALYFIGIGGIGMSGIAEILKNLGYTVQGSDLNQSANVKRLMDMGIPVSIGHDAKHVSNAAVVVKSSAIKDDNPELEFARAQKIPVVRRAEMLAELMRLKFSIAVAGTHGKTTTTSLVGTMLDTAAFDPTVINGGIINAYGTNTRLGQSDWMVVEADESDGTFTRLPATAAIITNVDPEHLESYGCFENVQKAFRRFIENLPFYGFGVLCIDHPVVQQLRAQIKDRRIISYGFSPQADIQIFNFETHDDHVTFDLRIKGWLFEGEDRYLENLSLPMLGEHNVLNATAAIAVALELNISDENIKKALSNFSGVKRRFTKTGEVASIRIIDDYAHHPVEISAVLKAARMAANVKKGRVIAVKQPHRFTRLHDLFEDFCTCFNDADKVYITDVYRAGETPIEGAQAKDLVEGLRDHGHKDVSYTPDLDTLADTLGSALRPDDIVICLGAGDITKWAYALPDLLTQHFAKIDQKTA